MKNDERYSKPRFFGFSQLTPMFEAMGQWAGWRGVSSTNPGGGGERLEC